VALPDALPQLRGRIGASVRGAFLALLALTALMLAAGGWMAAKDFFVTVPNNLEFGFMTGSGSINFPDPDQVRIYTATSDAARRSGLRRDDVILSIDGRPVPARATELEIGDMVGEVRGDTATIVTRSSGGAVRTHRLPRQAEAWSATIANTGLTGWQRSSILFGADQLRLFLLLAAAILLYRRRPRDPVALLFGTVFLLYCHKSGSAFWFWHTLGIAGVRPWLGVALYAFLVLGLNLFPNGRFVSLWSKRVALSVVPLFVLLLVVQQLFRPLPLETGGYALIALLAGSAAALIARYRRLAPGMERQQIKWAVAGFAGFALATAALLVPRLLGLFFLSDQGSGAFIGGIILQTLAAVLLPLGLLISLLRYRLYDADAALSRSASYSFLTVAVVAVFAAAKQGLELAAETYFDGSAIIASGGAAAALAALLITPMHGRVLRWSEERFRKPLMRLRDLPELVGDLRETARLGQLAEAVLERIEDGVRACRAVLLVDGEVVASRGPEGPTPVTVDLKREAGTAFGAILLGPRPDGSLYGRDERAALAEVAGPVARAIRIVGEREVEAAARAAEMAEVKARINLLEARLGEVPLAAE